MSDDYLDIGNDGLPRTSNGRALINHVDGDAVDNFVEEPTLANYQRLATRTAIYPGQGTPLGLAYCALKLNGEAGEFAEHVGKAMRDDNLIEMTGLANAIDEGLGCLEPVQVAHVTFHSLSPERKALLIKEVGDVLWYASAICNELGISLEDAATQNLVKLWDRSKRNTLQGSGDNR